MAEQVGDDLDGHAVTQPLGRHGVPQPVGIEVDPGSPSQSPHQVIDRRVGQRMTMRLAPEIDEHIVAVQILDILVKVVDIRPDQLGANRNRAGALGLGAGTVVVNPRTDCDLTFGGGPVLMPQSKGFPDPHPFSWGS